MTVCDVPRTLDAKPRLLFWEIDYVLAAAGGLVAGLLVSGMTAGAVFAVIFVRVWKRARNGGGAHRALAAAYWHLPVDCFVRVPQSARRHFCG